MSLQFETRFGDIGFFAFFRHRSIGENDVHSLRSSLGGRNVYRDRPLWIRKIPVRQMNNVIIIAIRIWVQVWITGKSLRFIGHRFVADAQWAVFKLERFTERIENSFKWIKYSWIEAILRKMDQIYWIAKFTEFQPKHRLKLNKNLPRQSLQQPLNFLLCVLDFKNDVHITKFKVVTLN